MDKNSLVYTRWGCKYHIVFALKYRRKIIYRKILRDLCNKKGIEIIATEACPEHIYVCENTVEI